MKRSMIFIQAGILLLALNSCLKEGELKQPYTGFRPVDISDGWVISNPSPENIDSLALDQIYRDIYSDDEMWMTKSLLVFRNGRLVAESYLKDDADRLRRDAIWSCTKQINGIITGIAIDQGYIGGVSDVIGDYLPEDIARHPDKSGITLDHLLTMRSGVDFDNGTQSDVFRERKVDSSVDYVLGLDLNFEPGTGYNYNDGEPQVVSGIIQAATGKTLDEYGKEVLLDRIGFTNYEWERYPDGLTLGAFGILTTPRELAKIGQCVMNDGRWGDQQIIPEDWLEEMLFPKVPDAGDGDSFGYYWWINPSKGYYTMKGHGGQFVYLIPAKNMLVVITSLSQVDDDVNIPYEKVLGIVDRIAATAE